MRACVRACVRACIGACRLQKLVFAPVSALGCLAFVILGTQDKENLMWTLLVVLGMAFQVLAAA